MSKENPVIECTRCLSLFIKGEWYKRHNAPGHAAYYKSGICPECWAKIQKQKGEKK